MSLNAFISYSHADAELAKALRDEFRRLEAPRAGIKKISFWMDDLIGPGTDWDASILKQLRSADIFLFVITANVHWSNYIIEKEYREAKRRLKDASWVKIVPLTADASLSLLKRMGDISRWQSIPLPKRTVIEHGSNSAWMDKVCEQLGPLIDQVWDERHA